MVCGAFNHTIPPVGTRVVYRTSEAQTLDGKKEVIEVIPEDHDFHGSIEKDNQSFGFIVMDGQDENDRLFVMPIACAAFGGKIPEVGTMVKFKVVMDAKTGRPRADFVRPIQGRASPGVAPGMGAPGMSAPGMGAIPMHNPNVQAAPPSATMPREGALTGHVSRISSNFGFIAQDGATETEVFFMPRGCKGFQESLPAVGTRVSYFIVTDEKTGRPRADDIQPEMGGTPGGPGHELLQTRVTGVVEDAGERGGGKYGWILQEDGSRMFCLPGSCPAFGCVIPPMGTKVIYDVINDPKTQRPRAENVQPFNTGGLVAALRGKGGPGEPNVQSWSPAGKGAPSFRTGVISKVCGGFGFISGDDGEEMFVLPYSCAIFPTGGEALPPLGMHVAYEVVMDHKTGRPRADNVRPSPTSGIFTGTIEKSGVQYGFIQQDMQDGSDVRMFVLPLSCGGTIPPVATRVMYEIVQDHKTGRPRAENVLTAETQSQFKWPVPEHLKQKSGSIIQAGRTYGFIQPDDGSEKMFVLPGSCRECGDFAVPPLGTRVVYQVTIDQKTGKPRADNVQLEVLEERTGSIRDSGEKFGFILQDDGEAMFVLPLSCVAFDKVIPPAGTRVSFNVISDPKTGRQRADDVRPEGQPASEKVPMPMDGGKGTRPGPGRPGMMLGRSAPY